VNEITNEQRAERNRKLAEMCGWEVVKTFEDVPYVEIDIRDELFGPTECLNDCKMVEEKRGLWSSITLMRNETGKLSWDCRCIDIKTGLVKSKSIDSADEPLARSAALEAIR